MIPVWWASRSSMVRADSALRDRVDVPVFTVKDIKDWLRWKRKPMGGTHYAQVFDNLDPHNALIGELLREIEQAEKAELEALGK